MPKRRVVYTSIMGGYETLNELAIDRPANIDFICFTDDPTLTSHSWRIIHTPPAFRSDPARSHRVVKIQGHSALAPFEESLYVDNTVRLLVDPNILLDSWLSTHDLAVPLHSFRSTVKAEFDAVIENGLDSRERILEQLDHYRRDFPAVLQEKPFWNGIIARRSTTNVASAMSLWLMHVLRYSRRDQLSLNAAAHLTQTLVNGVAIDNGASVFHEWPIASNRNQSMWISPPSDAEVEVEKLRTVLSEICADLTDVRSQLGAVHASTSWRMTRPLRSLARRSRLWGRRGM